MAAFLKTALNDYLLCAGTEGGASYAEVGGSTDAKAADGSIHQVGKTGGSFPNVSPDSQRRSRHIPGKKGKKASRKVSIFPESQSE